MVPAQIQKVKPNFEPCKPNSYSIGGLSPNHLDSVFHSIVDNLFNLAGSVRFGLNSNRDHYYIIYIYSIELWYIYTVYTVYIYIACTWQS